jgi:ABC-type uncharacterized transport system permease subunit
MKGRGLTCGRISAATNKSHSLLPKRQTALNMNVAAATLIVLLVRIALASLLFWLIENQAGPDIGNGARRCGRHPPSEHG